MQSKPLSVLRCPARLKYSVICLERRSVTARCTTSLPYSRPSLNICQRTAFSTIHWRSGLPNDLQSSSTATQNIIIQQKRYTSNSQPTSFSDPSRPELFYHLASPPTPFSSRVPAFALSFLPIPPLSPTSPTIIGWLPAAADGQDQEAGLNDFKENPKFRDLLHEAIQAGLEEGVDDIQINGAIQIQQGWMHINDDRNVPALGRVGDPDDILASVRVEEGKILSETYQPMPSYRFCTADGLIQLTDGLSRKLVAILEERDKTERTSR